MQPLSGLPVYLFTEAGSYQSQNKTTDGNGQVVFNLPEQSYKVRADYLGQQFWSGPFTWQNTPVTAPMSDAEITVTGAGLFLEGVNVYVFSPSGSYLSMSDTSGSDGKVTFRLPAGDYKFRADYQSSQYWTGEETLTAGQVNPISISTGGGALAFTVLKGPGNPLTGVNCYVFNEAGTYLGMNAATDSNGQVAYNLSDSSYKIRADYLGYQFWSPVYSVNGNISETLTIAHQDVTITVQGEYQGMQPLAGLPVYLFTESGAYQSQARTTNANGQVFFSLPEQAYKVRADYLGQQFWSDPFTWQNTSVTVQEGMAEIHITRSGADVSGARVYLFNQSGSYLSRFETTDATGKVQFRLPNRIYKFRVDEGGDQAWSSEIQITAGIVNNVNIDFSPVSVIISADPGTIHVGQTSTLTWTSTNADSAEIDQSIGSVPVSGSIVVTPAETTIYTITVTGTQGSAVASTTVTVTNNPPVAVDDLVSTDEDTPITAIAVLVNDSDPDGDTISISDFTQPVHGTSGSNGDGTLTYSPDANFNGTDSFTYTITDGTSESTPATVTVTINPVNDPPMTNAGTDQIALQGNVVTLNGSGSSDIDADSITYNWTFISVPTGSIATLSDSSIVNPTFTADIIGTYEVQLIVNDGTVNSAPDTVAVNIFTLPTVEISANPVTILTGESSTLTWTSTGAESCSIEPGIGPVDLNGSISVSPTETTVYTITVTGPGGTAIDTAEVAVYSKKDLAYGLEVDEQQGGGGLVGETVRILNGNVIESRSDLSFPSPHRFGLSFGATYNSQFNLSGALGFGWSHTYSTTLDPAYEMAGQTYVKVVDPTGRAVYFTEDTPGIYTGEFNERSQVKIISGDYVWYSLDGSRFGFSSAGRLLWVDDEKGNRLSLAYDGQNRLQTVTDTASGRVLTLNYNANGLIESILGPVTSEVTDGIYVTYGYDANQNLTSVTYADGSGFTYGYTDPGDVHNLTEKRNKANHLINTWSYDTHDRCIDNFSVQGNGVAITYVSATQVDVTDSYGTNRTYTIAEVNGKKRVTTMQGLAGAPYDGSNLVSWQYDGLMNLIEVETVTGTIHQYQNYDARGNPASVILATGELLEERTITYTFHPWMNMALTRSEPSVLGGGDKITIWDYDDDYDSTPNENPTNLLSRIIERGFTNNATAATVAYEYITTFNYNAKGQVERIDGPLAGTADTIQFGYDTATGNLLSITRPLVGITNFTNYDAAGGVGRVTDVNNQSETIAYDGRGRITGITHDADSSIRSISYNTAGLPETATDEDNVAKSYEYNTNGQLYRMYDTDGNYLEYLYDTQGNQIERSKHDSSGTRTTRKRWTYQHPNFPGKLWKDIKADDGYAEYGYDSEGNLNTVTDFNGNTTTYGHDALNRVTTVTQPGGILTGYDYDQHGNLTSVLDAENHETTYTYDDMGRMVTATSQDTGSVTYAYDAAGNPVQKTDPKGITVNYDYDHLRRLTAVRFPDAAQDITYSYDAGSFAVGRRTGMIDSSGATAFGYDSRGRLNSKTATVNAIDYTISRFYTPGSRLTSFVYPSGRTIDYTRYGSGRIQTVGTTYDSTTINLVNNLSYNPFGPAKGLDNGSGGTVNNTTNENGDLEVINPGDQMEQVYTYDGNRNLLSIIGTNTPWFNQDFNYDALNRLLSADGIYGAIGFTYDDVGNRLTRTDAGQVDTYTYQPGTNRLAQITGANPAAFSYDANGNITEIDGRTFVYSQNNRLVRVEDGLDILGEYTYNGLGQRQMKEAGGVATVFHYDFDGNIIAESLADGTMTVEYLYVDQSRMAMVSDGMLYFFHNNYLGTPVLMTDDTGTVVWEADYKPFGEANVNPNSEVVNNFRFAGQYFDEETGLHYNYFRYYDPKAGRYLAPDPIGLEGGINLFVYVLNDPVNKIDPLGLEIRVYSSDAFGIRGLNHAFVHSTETGRFKGTDGSSWVTKDDGRGSLGSPYKVVPLPPGMSESEFMDSVDQAKGWNNWIWVPWLNDCHADLESAFAQAGVPYPKAPGGRVDYDDHIKRLFGEIIYILNHPGYLYRLLGEL